MGTITVFGAFRYRDNGLSGQTVKTRCIYELVKNNADSVEYVDSTELAKSPYTLFSSLKSFACSKTILYLPAQHNLKYIFPFLFIFTKLFRTDVIYIQIGGWLVDFLSTKPFHRYMLAHIKCILTETIVMEESVKKLLKSNNVQLLYNFRDTNFQPHEFHTANTLKCVFMARVNKKKGLDWIFDFASHIDNNGLPITISLYGPIYNEDEGYLKEQIALHNCIEYVRPLAPEEIYETLEKYDVMLFPTHYYTEGLPGSIIDAYISGIPVVATNWKHAQEFIDDNTTGFIVPFEDGYIDFVNKTISLLNDSDMLHRFKKAASSKSNSFRGSNAWNILQEYLN